ncbi:MAG: oxidoreductase [Planctomycetaceae bacterium]|nr:MAG: oxidoreductase [Planctomycetaceae bacterium]
MTFVITEIQPASTAAIEAPEPNSLVKPASRVAVVIGATSGIGRATAISLSDAGWQVVATGRRQDRLLEIQEQHPKIQGMALDPADRSQVQLAFQQLGTQFGRIDLLVYAAGTNIPQRAWNQVSSEHWHEVLSVNLTGAYHCTQAVLPLMPAPDGGVLIYISSAAVQRPDASGLAYQASKHGLVGLAQALRVETKSQGIRTTVIYPGLCDTEILTKRPTATPVEIVQRALRPEDVAAAVLFVSQLPPRVYVPELPLVPAALW